MNFLFQKQMQNKTVPFSNKNTYKGHNPIITFSTCWYIMKSKFSVKKYAIWIANFLSIVNNFNLVIYTDANSLKMLLPLFDRNNNRIKIIIKPFESFYTYKYKDAWIKNHKSSNMELHKQVDWKLNMLWNEKIFFVNETIQNKYFDTPYYGWCDIGYFRNGPDDIPSYVLQSWPNNLSINQNKNAIRYACIQNNQFIYKSLYDDITDHYKRGLKTPPTNKYTENCFAGGFFILTQDLSRYYADIYDKKLQYYFTNNYFIKDDQFIVMDIIFTNPHLFCVERENNPLYNNWFMFQRLLG